MSRGELPYIFWYTYIFLEFKGLPSNQILPNCSCTYQNVIQFQSENYFRTFRDRK